MEPTLAQLHYLGCESPDKQVITSGNNYKELGCKTQNKIREWAKLMVEWFNMFGLKNLK